MSTAGEGCLSFDQRRARAAEAVAGVLGVLDDELRTNEILRWGNKFRGIQRVLDDLQIPDEEAVLDSGEYLRTLYAGTRNITDFYLVRTDRDEQRRVNVAYKDLLDGLWHGLNGDADGDSP